MLLDRVMLNTECENDDVKSNYRQEYSIYIGHQNVCYKSIKLSTQCENQTLIVITGNFWLVNYGVRVKVFRCYFGVKRLFYLKMLVGWFFYWTFILSFKGYAGHCLFRLCVLCHEKIIVNCLGMEHSKNILPIDFTY